MLHTKEQDKLPEEKLSEWEIANFQEREETNHHIIKMIKELGRRTDAQRRKLEVFNRIRKYKKT